MYKILQKFPNNRTQNIKFYLYKWKNKIVKYTNPNTELIKYVSRTKNNQILPIPLEESIKNNCKDIIIYDNKNKYKYIIENIIYNQYSLYGLYSCISAYTLSCISYSYIIYNDLELLFLL